VFLPPPIVISSDEGLALLGYLALRFFVLFVVVRFLSVLLKKTVS
jgi:hypothetical protein